MCSVIHLLLSIYNKKTSRFKDESMPTKLMVLFSFPRQPSVRSRRLEVTGRMQARIACEQAFGRAGN